MEMEQKHFPCFIFQHLKDKFWNFIFYKFIFIFGVLNVQTVDEVVMWCLWFSALVFLHLMVQLCKDRFEYVSTLKHCFDSFDVYGVCGLSPVISIPVGSYSIIHHLLHPPPPPLCNTISIQKGKL